MDIKRQGGLGSVQGWKTERIVHLTVEAEISTFSCWDVTNTRNPGSVESNGNTIHQIILVICYGNPISDSNTLNQARHLQ